MHEQTTNTLVSINACLLSFVPEAFVFHFAIKKYKEENTRSSATLNVHFMDVNLGPSLEGRNTS
jgi:hypothetical protein